MVMQTIGVSPLVRLMRQERAADLDSSWLLHGPQPDATDEAAQPPAPEFRWAAE